MYTQQEQQQRNHINFKSYLLAFNACLNKKSKIQEKREVGTVLGERRERGKNRGRDQTDRKWRAKQKVREREKERGGGESEGEKGRGEREKTR